MARPIMALGFIAALVLACDSNQPTETGSSGSARAVSAPRFAAAQATVGTLVSFGAMYGVDDAFVNRKEIRGVLGDELPWEVGSAVGSLSTDGHLTITVRGLVFSDVPEVPADLRGTNDEAEFRGLVSCLVASAHKVSTVNITTQGFPATPTGDSDIDATVQLPADCVAPIIFVLSGSEDKWFAVMGAEISG